MSRRVLHPDIFWSARFGPSLLACLFVFVLGAAAPVQAQVSDTRTLVPIPYNASPVVKPQVSTDRSSLTIGETVAICFQVSRPGYVTLWNVSATGAVARIFPNAFTETTATAMHVSDVTQRCAGKNDDPFRFRVDGPAGIDDLYLLWTDDAALQPRPSTYPDARRFADALARLGQAGPTRWATAKTSFDINDAGGARPPALAPPAATGQLRPPDRPPAAAPSSTAPPEPAGAPARPQPSPPPAQAPALPETPKVMVLSMGANVSPLTKTNQDARMFADVMRRLYGIPASDIRVVENVLKPQFKAGMDWLRERARPQDVVVIYFSGHGAQAPDRSGRSADGIAEAFVPYEFKAKARPEPRDLIWSWEFVEWVNALPAASVLTVVDACHSAGLYRSIEATVVGAKEKFFQLPSEMTFDGVEELKTKSTPAPPLANAKGTLLAAARRDQSALEGSKGGIFTLELVRGIGEARSGTLTDSFTDAARMVNQLTRNRQSPTLVGSRDAADRLQIGAPAARP